MRIVKILLFLPPLAYGAALGYLWYEVKTTADDAAKMAAPFAEITYGSVHVSAVGDEVGLDNVVIKPTTTQDEFRIERLRFTVPHIGYFISAGRSVAKGELPEKLGMQIGRMHLDLNSKIFSMLEEDQSQAATPESGGLELLSNLDALGCGELETFALGDYRQMGIGAMIMDVGANFGYDKGRSTALVTVNANATGLYRVDFRAEFKTGPNINRAVAESSIPKSTIKYRDSGYYKLRNAYCAGRNDSSEEAYVDRHLQRMGETLGVTLPEKAATAYKRFMLKGGSLDVTVDPKSGVDPKRLQSYSLEDLLSVLGVGIAINGKKMAINEIQWAGSKRQDPRSGSPANEVIPQPEAGAESPTPMVKTAAQSADEDSAPAANAIRAADAGKHINSMVEITTDEGKVRSGLLERVSDDRIYLTMRLSTGTLIYPVELRKITKLRVIN